MLGMMNQLIILLLINIALLFSITLSNIIFSPKVSFVIKNKILDEEN